MPKHYSPQEQYCLVLGLTKVVLLTSLSKSARWGPRKCFVWPHARIHVPNGTWIGSAVFARLTLVTIYFVFFPFLSTISSFFPLSMPFSRFLPHFRDIGATTAEKLEGTSCGLGVDPLLFPPVFLLPLLTLFHVAPFQPFLPYTFPLKSTQGVCINAISSIPTLSWRSLPAHGFLQWLA